MEILELFVGSSLYFFGLMHSKTFLALSTFFSFIYLFGCCFFFLVWLFVVVVVAVVLCNYFFLRYEKPIYPIWFVFMLFWLSCVYLFSIWHFNPILLVIFYFKTRKLELQSIWCVSGWCFLLHISAILIGFADSNRDRCISIITLLHHIVIGILIIITVRLNDHRKQPASFRNMLATHISETPGKFKSTIKKTYSLGFIDAISLQFDRRTCVCVCISQSPALIEIPLSNHLRHRTLNPSLLIYSMWHWFYLFLFLSFCWEKRR